MIFYEDPFKLELIGRFMHKNGNPLPHTTRSVSDLTEVLMDPQKAGPDGIAYYMFREVAVHETLRYDITLIPPRMFGDEYVKTYGHYHPKAKEGLSYPELYQILAGEAVFIMQTPQKDGSLNCIITKCSKKDVVFVPPNYGHVMVNPNPSTTLISANIVSNSFSSKYEEYKENRGAAYYYTKTSLTQNPNCIIKKTDEVSPKDLLSRYRLTTEDLLEEITKRPEKLSFLEDPTLL